jgi:hypothetical protein
LISSDLDEVTKNLSDKIDSLVLSSMGSQETETEDEPENQSNDNTEDKPKKEKKMSEYYRRRLSKKIREMVRSVVIDKKTQRINKKA